MNKAPRHTGVALDLPSLVISEARLDPSQTEAVSKHLSWWVKSSATQELDASGLPLGFKDTLMFNHRAIQSGIGADKARAFKLQVSFLNLRGAIPIVKTKSPRRSVPAFSGRKPNQQQ